MTVPPLRKWRFPKFGFYRDRFDRRCWQFFVWLHEDYNPVVIVERWNGRWHFEFFRG